MGEDEVDRPSDRRPDTEELAAQICSAAGQLASRTCSWLEMIAEFDERKGWTGAGILSCAHWLAWACSMSPGSAREHVRVARALTGLPRLKAAFAAGELSYTKVREATRVADRVDEQWLLELAKTATASQLQRSVRAFRRADGDRLRQELRRRARWHLDDDGSLTVTATLPPEEAAVVHAALEQAMNRLQRAEDQAMPKAPDDGRPTSGALARAGVDSERQPPPRVNPADALVELASQYLAGTPADVSGADRHLVVVHVDAAHLDTPIVDVGVPDTRTADADLGPAVPARGACEISGIGGITPSTAQRLACDAVLLGIIRGSGGKVLHHGHRRRLVSPAQRRVLAIRDGHCRYPSCPRVTNLEAHHVIPWHRGGPTDLDNLVLLCRFHHLAVHEGIAVLRSEPGSLSGRPQFVFTSHDGSALPDRPNPTITEADQAWWQLRRVTSWKDPAAQAIRPDWRGEQFSLGDTVNALFGNKQATPTEGAAA